MSVQLRFVLLAVAAAIVFVTGFLLTRTGRPYSTGLLTIHKLIDLAGIVFIAVIAVGGLRGGAVALDWALVIAALLLALATFATGGVASASENVASWVLVAHRALPWPLVLAAGLTAYRFMARG